MYVTVAISLLLIPLLILYFRLNRDGSRSVGSRASPGNLSIGSYLRRFWSSPGAGPLRFTVYALAVAGCITLVILAFFGNITGPEVEAMGGPWLNNLLFGAAIVLSFVYAFGVMTLPVAGLVAWVRFRNAERERVRAEEEYARQQELHRIEEEERQERARREEAERQRWKQEQQERTREAQRRAEKHIRREEEERQRRISEILQRDKVLDRIHHMNGHEFERIMADLFRKQGYPVRITPGSGDQGIDLLVDMDGRTVAVQLKRWVPPVGNAHVHATFAGMAIHEAQEAWQITTSSFTKSAREAAQKTGVRLVDGKELAAWMKGLRDEQ